LRVLKPGGHLIAFGGTRTYHRLAVAIEDAGFEVRDCLMWLYGSGFPKSQDVSKAMDKKQKEAPPSPNAGKWKPSSSGAAPNDGTGWGYEPTVPFTWKPSPTSPSNGTVGALR
jgi:DNA modification methylase